MVEMQTFIIAMVVMLIFVTGVSTFTGDLANTFPNVQNTTFITDSAETATNVKLMQEQAQSASSATSIIDVMLNGVWKVLMIIFNVLKTFIGLMTDLQTTLKIPANIFNLFVVIATVTVVFGIAYLVMNMPNR